MESERLAEIVDSKISELNTELQVERTQDGDGEKDV